MNHGTTRPGGRGFSVLELTIAIAIMGVMMAVAGFALIKYLSKAKVSATEATMRQVGSNLTSYLADKGSFPPNLRALVPDYMDKYPRDGWGQEFFYSPQGPQPNTFILISAGEDKQDGTEDDINYEDLFNQE
jgi:prepilin-type N-terminal cleavage/methylation domain-containing protein